MGLNVVDIDGRHAQAMSRTVLTIGLLRFDDISQGFPAWRVIPAAYSGVWSDITGRMLTAIASCDQGPTAGLMTGSERHRYRCSIAKKKLRCLVCAGV